MLQWLFGKPENAFATLLCQRGLNLEMINIDIAFQQARQRFSDTSSKAFEDYFVILASQQQFVNSFIAKRNPHGWEQEARAIADAGKALATKILRTSMVKHRAEFPDDTFEDFLLQKWPDDFNVLCKHLAGHQGYHRNYKEWRKDYDELSPETSYCIVMDDGQS